MTTIAEYIATARTFDRNGTAADYIAVLSHNRVAAQLRSDQPMTRRVVADAKARHDRYMGSMATGKRAALPAETVYYVWDKATGAVLGLITADGTVELATDFRTPQQARSIREGFKTMQTTRAYRVHAGER